MKVGGRGGERRIKRTRRRCIMEHTTESKRRGKREKDGKTSRGSKIYLERHLLNETKRADWHNIKKAYKKRSIKTKRTKF